MHIVYLVHKFRRKGIAVGGAENYIANIATIMARKGHRVDVVVEANEDEVYEWEGITVHCIRATRGFKDTGRHMSTGMKVAKNFWRSYWYNKEVLRIDKKDKVDLVQSVNIMAIPIFRVKRIPYIVRMSSYAPLFGGAEREEFNYENCLQSKRLDEEIQFFAIKRADCIISPSILVKKLLEEKIKKEVLLVESPVDIGKTEDLVLREENLTADKYLVTYGAMTYRKSIHIIAKIIDLYLDKYPDMKYVVIGIDKELYHNGEYMMASKIVEKNIIRNKDRYVFIPGISDRKRLFSIVYNSYACVLPTRIDNLPNACLEAMALGRVVISSNGTSVEQLIEDGENGFLTKVDDKDSLLKAIDKVMELSVQERQEIGKRAQCRVNGLTPENTYNKMIEVYHNAIKKSTCK